MRFVLVLLALSGCAQYGYRFTKTTRHALPPPEPANCDFGVAASMPEGPYEELGVLDAEQAVSSMASFREVIAERVCAVGGDLVIGEVNGYGYYVRGIVFRHLAEATPTPAP